MKDPSSVPLFPSASTRTGDDAGAPKREVLTVATLGRTIRREVERMTSDVYVSGEVQSVRDVGSGHVYFTLKDEVEDAQVACVLYRSAPVRARRALADGARVILRGRATVYAPRGQLQFVADDAKAQGRGQLLEALDELKRKLAAEGLFRPERKRPLPKDPRVIGVVTSKDGAAFQDIVKVAFRRARVRIVLARAPVQGARAGLGLARALAALAKHGEVEAIILGRGGGSSEDLMAFNDERLVRAVAACAVPVVTAVGHEIDTTLVDLAGDRRAATPSEAAELLLPDARERLRLLKQLEKRLERGMQRRLDEGVAAVDRLREALVARARRSLDDRRRRTNAVERRVHARHPSALLRAARADLAGFEARIPRAMASRIALDRRTFERLAARLDALSPLAVLGRGYAIAERTDGRVVRSASEVEPGMHVTVRVADGRFDTRVVDGGARPATPPAGGQTEET
ncbi:MAG: exodeoxyribonuclease VII large subunit [Polyangiaceae bacterium]